MVCHGFEFAVDGNFEVNFHAVNVNSCCVCVYIYTEGESSIMRNVICMILHQWAGSHCVRRLLLVSIQPSEVTVRVSWNFDTANLLCCRDTQITGSTALWVPRNCGRTKDL